MTSPQAHHARASLADVQRLLRHDYDTQAVAIIVGEADLTGQMFCRRLTLTANGDGTYDLKLYAS